MNKVCNFTFKFKPVNKSYNRKKEVIERKIGGKVQGYIFLENGEYKVHVDVPKDTDEYEELKPQLVLNFTPESYDLKGHMKVFTKCKLPSDKWICYCRTKEHATIFTGDINTLVPFCHNWICTGWIVKYKSQLMFKFKHIISIRGYNMWCGEEDD